MDKGKWILDKGEKNVKVKKNHETYNRSARVLFSNKWLSLLKHSTSVKQIQTNLISANLKISPAHTVYLSLPWLYWAVRIKDLLSGIKYQISTKKYQLSSIEYQVSSIHNT